ncbi:MAG: HAD family phosphatase [Calditrichia bacterium]
MSRDFAVIFDMDGVIVDSNPTHRIALKEFCEKHGFPLSESDLRNKVYGRTNRDWLTNLFNNSITPAEIDKYEEEKEQLFRKLYAPLIHPVKGLIPFLESLKRNGIVRAIATSAPRSNVKFTLEKTGTAQFFEVVLDEEDIGKSKPDPEIYLKTAAAIGFPPQKCIVIEDSLSGVEAARRAGCKVIGITTTHPGNELSETQMVIRDFADLEISDLERLAARK